MSPIRGHLLLLGLTGTVCAGAFVLDFLYVRQGNNGEAVAKALSADWWHDGRASLGIKGQTFWAIACAGHCALLLASDIIFPTVALLHVWFELAVLLLMAGSGIGFGVLAGLSDLKHLFRGLDHDKTFCLLGLLGILIGYVGAILALICAIFVWRVPRRIVQSSDGKRYWRRSIRQIYHNRYTGLPPDVIFADLGESKKESSRGGESWYQESAYALNTHQRTSWIPPDHGAQPPRVPPNPYSTPYDR